MKRFAGRVALVTGGGGGIGGATVLRFAREGSSVVVVDLDRAAAERTAEQAAAAGVDALPVASDVGDPEGARAMIAAAMERFGRLDVLVGNAGLGGGGVPVLDLDVAEWDRLIRVNLRGVFLTCKFGLPALIESGGGAIVNMGSSMAGWDAARGGSAYMASKEGVIGLTRNLALEAAEYGVRVNAVCPGVIETALSLRQQTAAADEEEWRRRFARFAERIPLRRVGQPEDVAAAIAFLASDDASHITGSALLIDGGQTLQSWSNAPDGAYPRATDQAAPGDRAR